LTSTKTEFNLQIYFKEKDFSTFLYPQVIHPAFPK